MSRHSTALLVLPLVLSAGHALSQGLSVGLNLSQGFGTVSRFGDTDDERLGLSTSTDLGLSFTGDYGATTFGLSVGTRLSGNTDREGGFFAQPNPRVVGRISRSGPRLTTFASLSVIPEFTDERTFDLLEVTDEETDEVIRIDRRLRDENVLQLRIGASAGARYRLDSANSLSLSLSASAREYPDGSETLDPNRSFSATASWSRSIDSRTSGGFSLGTRLFTSEGDDRDDTVSNTLSANLSRRFTSRHSGRASLGVSFTEVDATEPNLVGGVNFSYQPTSDISMGAGFNQNVAQDDEGEVRLVSRLSGSARWSINSASSINFGTSASFDSPIVQDSIGDDELTLRLSAGYSLQLAENWRLSLSYALSYETDRDDPFASDYSGSQRVFMQISRNFDILP